MDARNADADHAARLHPQRRKSKASMPPRHPFALKPVGWAGSGWGDEWMGVLAKPARRAWVDVYSLTAFKKGGACPSGLGWMDREAFCRSLLGAFGTSLMNRDILVGISCGWLLRLRHQKDRV
jgi:hypothetical protein